MPFRKLDCSIILSWGSLAGLLHYQRHKGWDMRGEGASSGFRPRLWLDGCHTRSGLQNLEVPEHSGGQTSHPLLIHSRSPRNWSPVMEKGMGAKSHPAELCGDRQLEQ